MSELKGSILGVLLTIILFGTLSACLTAAFAKMSKSVTDEVSEVTEDLNN